MTQLMDNIWAVEVPDGAIGLDVDGDSLMYYDNIHDASHDISLPPGSWRFLFTTNGATENDARQVVRSCTWYFPEKHIRFVDYAHPYDHENKQRWSEGFGTAIESLHSLLRSKGCNTERNYALIQKLNK